MIWAARRAGLFAYFARPGLDEDMKRFFKSFGPAVIGSAGVQIALFADTIIGSLLPAGGLSSIYYADRLYQLPVGVIGVAVFRRKVEAAVGQGRLQESKPEADRDASASAGSRAADVVSRQPAAPAAAEKNLGTGHGASESAPVRYTRFERASATPDEVITLYYDSARNLQAAGVIAAPRITRPVAFPGPFVPDPR